MNTATQDEEARIRGLLFELAAKQLDTKDRFIYAGFGDAKWVRDGLAALGVATQIESAEGSIKGSLRIAVPDDEAASLLIRNALKTVLAPEALLFDIDDTLADVSESYRGATVATAAKFGAKVTYDDITAAKAAGDANNDWVLTWKLVRERGIDASLIDVTEKFEELYQGTQEKPGLRATEKLLVSREMLAGLATKYPLGIVTGRPRSDALAFLETQGIRDYFKAIVTMDDGPLKPDPAPTRLALKKLDVKRAWLVGDTPDDMRSAAGAGVLPLGVIAPADDPEVARVALINAGAARVLNSIANIEELLP